MKLCELDSKCTRNSASIPKVSDPDKLLSSPVCPRPGGIRLGGRLIIFAGHRHVPTNEECPFPLQDEVFVPFLDETDGSIICDDLISGGIFCADLEDETGESFLDETDGSVICDDLVDVIL